MDLKNQSYLVITDEWFHLSYRFVAMLLVGILSCLAIISWLGWQLSHPKITLDYTCLDGQWQENLQAEQARLKALELQASEHFDVLTQHIGRIEANLIQINALGERMVSVLHLDPNEFNFNEQTPMTGQYTALKQGDPLLVALQQHAATLEKRYAQLSTLHRTLQRHLAQDDIQLKGSGKPVIGGYVSSFFGQRQDPINGRKAWHAGVDIAAKEGAEIKALASGIVSYAGVKGRYGKLVEINHGNGLMTRYGHNKALLVQSGQLVRKGEAIALLGTSGRSTGPHVHLEVHKDGQTVDPGRYFSDLSKS